MRNIWKYAFVLFLTVGCGPFSPADKKSLVLGTVEEKNAEAAVKRLAVQHGYHPEKMNLEVKMDPETGDILIFLFPKPIDSRHLLRELGLFAIVQAKTGAVIRFSDPASKPKK
jgi:hypothetical protein